MKTRDGMRIEDLLVPSITTKRRLTVLRAVRKLTRDYEGIPPTVREIAESIQMTRSSTYRHVSALCDVGLLTTHSADSQRGVRIVPSKCYDDWMPSPHHSP